MNNNSVVEFVDILNFGARIMKNCNLLKELAMINKPVLLEGGSLKKKIC